MRPDVLAFGLTFTPFGNKSKINAMKRWYAQMEMPMRRTYHNENHIWEVVSLLFDWGGGWEGISEDRVALFAAALYHDVIYDATRKDNEIESAKFCRAELEDFGKFSEAEINETARLIELTAGHVAAPDDTDGILLLDADLFVLGDTPENYAAYVRAVRTEYAHVSDEAWRSGRRAIMRTFLERPCLYYGNWEGRDEWEAQARANIAREIAALTRPQ